MSFYIRRKALIAGLLLFVCLRGFAQKPEDILNQWSGKFYYFWPKSKKKNIKNENEQTKNYKNGKTKRRFEIKWKSDKKYIFKWII